jgi:hypothetical protein
MLYPQTNHGTVALEWIALAGVVVIVVMTALVVVQGSAAVHAANLGNSLDACESYAAQHGGSTSGC